jgi:imidazolonepropionase
MLKLIGPFCEIVDTSNVPLKGKVSSNQLSITKNGGIIVEDGWIKIIGNFNQLRQEYPTIEVEEIENDLVSIPGFVDAHTHLCWSGDRIKDYDAKLEGKTYLEIATAGGGIWSTVEQTKKASSIQLESEMLKRAYQHLKNGVTTIEVKSGYGLGVEEELKILRAIQNANSRTVVDLIPTCLAAHMKPKDFDGNSMQYLQHLVTSLLPQLKQENLTNRIDIFIEASAFSPTEALYYLEQAKSLGFDLTVHGDQFSVGGSKVAIQYRAISVDHLEASGEKEIELIAQSNTVAVALPGASIGLGMAFAPARKILDAGGCLAIASDWNPGSAPMGDLLTQACILGAYEKLSIAETLCGLTSRAAAALNLKDRGTFAIGQLADFQAYPVKDYRSIFYHQGSIKPMMVWKEGERVE